MASVNDNERERIILDVGHDKRVHWMGRQERWMHSSMHCYTFASVRVGERVGD